jgi:hypothetical protein
VPAPSDDRRDPTTTTRPRSTDESTRDAARREDGPETLAGDDDALSPAVREEIRTVVREEVSRVVRDALALLVGGVLGFAGFATLATGLTASGYGGVAVVAAVLALAAGAVLLVSTGWRLVA